MNRNRNSANFFSYVCNSKKIKALFASTLNGIPASVKSVFSMTVVLNAKQDSQKRRSPAGVSCFAS